MIKIVFAGDILIANSCFDIGFGLLEKVEDTGSAKFIRESSKAFEGANLSIANLEFVISDTSSKKGIHKKEFISPTSFLKDIKGLGVDIFSVANNHIMQHEEDGFVNTIEALKKTGISTIGSTNNKGYEIIDIQGLKIGIISASTKYDPFVKNPQNYYFNIYPNVLLDEKEYGQIYKNLDHKSADFFEQICSLQDQKYVVNIEKVRSSIENEVHFYDIMIDAYCENIIRVDFLKKVEELKDKCDFLIVYMHWGDEYVHIPAKWQTRLGHKLVDLGAQLIVGCHSHTIQGIEVYKNVPILYSLGNFFFNSNNPAALESILFELELYNDKSKVTGMNHRIVPYKFNTKYMYPEKLNKEYSDKIKRKFENYSIQIGNQSRDEYVQEVLEGIKISRKYKKKHVLYNLFKIKKQDAYYMLKEFIKRRINKLIN